MKTHYTGLVTRWIERMMNKGSIPWEITPDDSDRPRADQHQQNGGWGIHQLRVRLPGDDTVYRVLVAPADAPIFVGRGPHVDGCPIDQHFVEPIEPKV